MKKKNALIILLIASALAIWSNNIYRIIRGLQQTDDSELPLAMTSRPAGDEASLLPTHAAFVYEAKYRDPFENWLEERSQKTKQPVVAPRVEKVVPIPPALRFTGIVRDQADVLAIIEAPDGQVFFAQPQDTIAGVKLVRIDSSSVTCEFAKQRFRIELQ